MAFDAVLVIDKPAGLTSHDVVAAARRALGETRIGHTGTLDPMATGVLPLACGRATRLVQFLTASDKSYDAEIRIGLATDTYDITGRETGRSAETPSGDAIRAALDTLRGDYLQAPPPYSAKKIGGRRAYELARADRPVQPAPVPVSVRRLDLTRIEGDVVSVTLTCSAGFYVRSLAHDLGARLGTGACLQALRRIRSGDFDLASAVGMDLLAANPGAARERAIPADRLLGGMPAARLTEEGSRWVSHGRAVGPAQLSGPVPVGASWVRLLEPGGGLVALARPGDPPGSLHPSVVLI